MSQEFAGRLLSILPQIVRHFGTPFHIYDEEGILEGGERLKAAFAALVGFNDYYAVKALPNPAILQLMTQLGFGFDCSSIPELTLARGAGATPLEIMFTSNNTSQKEFSAARANGGCILNLDDLALVAKVPEPFPKLICFRYNPGPRRAGLNSVIGNPETCKYGVPYDQIVEAYCQAINRGARKFGLHTMVVSNERDERCFAETVSMLLDVVRMVSDKLNITFDFINMGGGLGIPYKLSDQPLNLDLLAQAITVALQSFQAERGYQPRLLMESGRWVTGPHGVLVTTCLNTKTGYRKFVGIDAACTASMMRPAMYYPDGGYHEIEVFSPAGERKQWNGLFDQVLFNPLTQTSVVGPACEDNDRFGWDRLLPEVEAGDLVVIHDTGAHCYAMANNYNGRRRPQELMLRADGTVELIRRAETAADLFATLNFQPNILSVQQQQQLVA